MDLGDLESGMACDHCGHTCGLRMFIVQLGEERVDHARETPLVQPDSEIVLGKYCSRTCRDAQKATLLAKAGLLTTPKMVGLEAVEVCASCAGDVNMCSPHTTLATRKVDLAERDIIWTIGFTYWAHICTRCRPTSANLPPIRLQ
jgi:hypothetical protein